ncbi:hypothetical protein AO262_32350 [Pseudomonas fluorescens ABAC62]|nr:hypothetical protein AO262_32350 [Pseudomonas fluorescens ABAC62]
MRILIADVEPENGILTDKMLGMLGYFSICTVDSFDDLLTLTHYTPPIYDRFNLLIVHADLVQRAGVDVSRFCRNNSRLRHVLIHGDKRIAQREATLCALPHRQVRAIETLDYEQLEAFMAVIDPDACRPLRFPTLDHRYVQAHR